MYYIYIQSFGKMGNSKFSMDKMEERIISTRVDKELHNSMKFHEEINWSAVIRKALLEKIKKTEAEGFVIDKQKAREAIKIADKIRKSRMFEGGKSSTQIIREWRDKRR